MKKKKKNVRHFTLKKIEEEIDTINEKILDNVKRYYSFQTALDSISNTIKKLSDKKAEIHTVLLERKNLTKNLTTISKLQKLMKK